MIYGLANPYTIIKPSHETTVCPQVESAFELLELSPLIYKVVQEALTPLLWELNEECIGFTKSAIRFAD